MASSSAVAAPEANCSQTSTISMASAETPTGGTPPLVLPCAAAGVAQRLRAAMTARAARIALALHRLDDLLGRVVEIVGRDHVETRLVEDGLAFLDIGAFQANHQRDLQPHFLDRRDH